MPDFYVNVICEECGEKHSAQVRVFLGDGPAEEMSIAEAYGDQALSDSISSLLENTVSICPKSGNKFRQKDPQKVFLRRQVDPPMTAEDISIESVGQNPSKENNFLELLAQEFSRQTALPQVQRENVAAALRSVAQNPVSAGVVKKALSSMLF